MDLLHEHLSMIHSKVADLVKAKDMLLKKEKANQEFRNFVIEQLADQTNPIRPNLTNLEKPDQAMFAKKPI